MSSSEATASPRRFLAGLVAGLAGASLVLGAVLLLIDPLGATDGNRLCAAGAKARADRTAKMLVAHDRRPRTLIIGTSRVQWGFRADALSELGAEPVVNLGFSGGLPVDFSEGADEALAGGRLERAYIGVDFNIVHQDNGPESSIALAASRFPRLERLRRAFLSYEALRSAGSALGDCRPRFHPDGSPTIESYRDRAMPTIDDERTVLRRTWGQGRGQPAREAAARLSELRSLIARLRGQDVEVVVFSAPYREELVATFVEVGLADDFAQFRVDLSRLAREEGAAFVDLHGAAGLRALDLQPCPRGGIACHYIDLTHYSPAVGQRIARALAPGSTQRHEPASRP